MALYEDLGEGEANYFLSHFVFGCVGFGMTFEDTNKML